MIVYKFYLLLFMVSLLSACQNVLIKSDAQTDPVLKEKKSFEIESVGKSDIDVVVERNLKIIKKNLKELLLKLYLRNPLYWRHSSFSSAQEKVAAIESMTEDRLLKQLMNKRSIASILLAFDEKFTGDRVLAFVYGLQTMLKDAYEGKEEFYFMDQLDPQKLYHAARNIEVAVWRLSNNKDSEGRLYLVSNALTGPVKNLSFERLFGKLIALQDNSAYIVADSTNRTIKNVIQGVARFIFLPI